MRSEVGPASFAQSIENFNLFSFVDAFESRRHPHIGGFVVGSRVVCGRPGWVERSALGRCVLHSLLVVECARRCRLGCLASSGICPRCRHSRQPVTASSGGSFAPVRAQFERCCAGLTCAAPLTENRRFVKHHVWEAAVCNTCVGWWLYQWHESTVWYLIVGFCACYADAHLN